MMKSKNIPFLTSALAAILLVSCSHNPKDPGRVWMPDMTYSNAYETYSPSSVPTPDGYDMSARKPVKGTIPRGWIPDDEKIKTTPDLLMSYMAKNHFTHDPAKWQEEYDRAGATIKDPLPYSEENMAEGKRLYEINCAVCHGQKGQGDGPIVKLPDGSDGPFTAVPPVYSNILPQLSDGNIFYAVSYGKGMMGGYGFQLNVNERWQVIEYIKSLGGIKQGAAADSTAKK